jgi:uncharacterized RDD family membrane protein YckC
VEPTSDGWAPPVLAPAIAPAKSPLPGTLVPQPSPMASPPTPRPEGRAREAWPSGAHVVPLPLPEPRPAAPAPALARLGAFLVDFVIVGAFQAALSLPAFFVWLDGARRVDQPPADVSFLPIFGSVALAAVAAILSAVYYVYFWGLKGATPGKRLFGLAVEGPSGTLPIGPSRALLRLLGYGVSGLVFGIGFLMIAFGGHGLHDQIAHTRVVRRRGA